MTVGLDAGVGLGEGERGLEPVEEELAIPGQAGEVVVHRVVQQALLGGLELGDVGERADEAHHLAVEPTTGRALSENHREMAVRRAQPEVLRQPAAPLLNTPSSAARKAVAVERVEHLEPARRHRAFEPACV